MADNVYLTPEIIAAEGLMLLENYLVFGNTIYKEYQEEFHKIGDHVNVRMPVHFLTGEGEDISESINRIVERKQVLEIDRFRHCAWNYSYRDLTLTIEEYSKRHMQNAVARLANDFDDSISECYKQFFNAVGDCAAPSTYDDIATPATLLTELGVPANDRHLILNPAAKQSVTNNISALYMQALAEKAYKKGDTPNTISGMMPYESQNVYKHTSNAQATAMINTALTKNSTTTDEYGIDQIKMDGLDGDLVVGDLFAIAGVYSINPMSQRSTGRLQSFVVKEDVSYTGNADTVKFSPAIIMSDGDYPQYQNMDSYPSAGAAVTFKASHIAHMAYHRQAIAAVVVPLELPEGKDFAARASSKVSGLSVRVWKGSDILTNKLVIRLDIMWGVKALYPELGCRLCG